MNSSRKGPDDSGVSILSRHAATWTVGARIVKRSGLFYDPVSNRLDEETTKRQARAARMIINHRMDYYLLLLGWACDG